MAGAVVRERETRVRAERHRGGSGISGHRASSFRIVLLRQYYDTGKDQCFVLSRGSIYSRVSTA